MSDVPTSKERKLGRRAFVVFVEELMVLPGMRECFLIMRL
jgi:hypothetical protein